MLPYCQCRHVSLLFSNLKSRQSHLFFQRCRITNRPITIVRQRISNRIGWPLKHRIKLLINPAIFSVVVATGCHLIVGKPEPVVTPEERMKQRRHIYKWLAGILFISSLVLIGFNYPNHIPPHFRKLMMRSIVSDINVRERYRVVSMIGSMFGHNSLTHYLLNMAYLCLLAHAPMNHLEFANVYLTGGLLGSAAGYILVVLTHQPVYRSVGASGAVFALMMYVLAKYPEFYFDNYVVKEVVPPTVDMQGVIFWPIVLLEVLGVLISIARWRSPLATDNGAHMGGIVYGWLAGRDIKQKGLFPKLTKDSA